MVHEYGQILEHDFPQADELGLGHQSFASALKNVTLPRLRHFTLTMRQRRSDIVRCSIVVSISACHAEDPGSIPGGGVLINQKVKHPILL